MNRFFFSSSLLLVFVLVSNLSVAQNSLKGSYWVSAGLGAAPIPSAMIAVGYEFADRPTLAVLRYVDNRQLLSDNLPGIKVKEIGLLYGIKTGKFRFSTGLSGVWGVNRGKYLSSDPDPLTYGSNYYEPVRYMTVGVPGEIRFMTSNKDIGIGITAFGNLNAQRSFAGLNLSFYIGQMAR